MIERYQVRRKPGRIIRVVDLEDDRIEGYWLMSEGEWFDARSFIDGPRQDYQWALADAYLYPYIERNPEIMQSPRGDAD